MRRRSYKVILIGVESEQPGQPGGIAAIWKSRDLRGKLVIIAFVIEYWAAIQFVVVPLLSR